MCVFLLRIVAPCDATDVRASKRWVAFVSCILRLFFFLPVRVFVFPWWDFCFFPVRVICVLFLPR